MFVELRAVQARALICTVLTQLKLAHLGVDFSERTQSNGSKCIFLGARKVMVLSGFSFHGRIRACTQVINVWKGLQCVVVLYMNGSANPTVVVPYMVEVQAQLYV